MQAEATSKIMRNRFRPGKKKKRRISHPRRVFTNSLSGSKKMFSASLPDFNDALSTMLKSTSSIAPSWWLNHPSCSQNAHCFPKDRGWKQKNIWNRHLGTKMSNLRMLFQPLPNLLAPLLSEGTMDCLDHTWRMRWQLEKRQWKRTARPYGWSNWMGHTILKIFKKIMPRIGPLSASKNSKGGILQNGHSPEVRVPHFKKWEENSSTFHLPNKIWRKELKFAPFQIVPNPESGKDHLNHPDFQVWECNGCHQITEIKLQSTTGHGSFGKWLVCDGNYHEHQPFM